ncbi:hypothetical protein SUGI_0490490 [Cryptomeria japonica]|uniref:36.4 kDa proline-rich protein-like n=1 Tax=Cryptomeria japonica TaxID=3369 RepID=UPI002408EAAA|nr:36.4 kDa proline-rich protein-like [Cryptomeria japonica]GLJ25605.1 hypothetical protein SUGI_0490490 [Cryptomeria japonica]
MKKARARLFIVMIQVATTMPLIMAWTPPPPPTSVAKCPLDALKLGACVDVLSGLVHVGVGDPVLNQCCPVIEGVLALEAALCLCTTIRAKLLNLNILLPVALELIVACGKTVPPGFKCPAQ